MTKAIPALNRFPANLWGKFANGVNALELGLGTGKKAFQLLEAGHFSWVWMSQY
jgi:hypothetical protein